MMYSFHRLWQYMPNTRYGYKKSRGTSDVIVKGPSKRAHHLRIGAWICFKAISCGESLYSYYVQQLGK